MTMHFLFIYAFFIRGIDNAGPAGITETFRTALLPLWVSVAMLAVSHGISFVANFLGRREYQSTSVNALMTAPYSRIILMQIVLIAGGWVVMLVRSPTIALVLLIGLKTAVDLRAHLREHS